MDALAPDFTNKQIYAGGLFTTILGTSNPYFVGLKNSDDSELPVELVSFSTICHPSAGKDGISKIELRWKTETEVNNYGFEIERRQIGAHNWQKVGFAAGNGTSNIEHTYSYTDQVQSGTYAYRLKQIDNDGAFEYSYESEVIVGAPSAYTLRQNYPNPFNPATVISYDVPKNEAVSLKIYNALGQEVMILVNETKEAGSYTERFNASNLPSGLYYAKLTIGTMTKTIKMTLVK